MRLFQILSCIAVTAILLACGYFGAATTNPSLSSKPPEPSNAEKIVGTWEFVKSTEKDAPPPGSTVEFTKEGKVKMTIKVQNRAVIVDGTYSVDGDTLKVTTKGPNGKEAIDTMKIKTLTEKEMVTEEKTPGNVGTTELKKK
jgi:uncharacterized protein (TIGR03066 family)